MPDHVIAGEADERGWGMNALRVLRRRWPIFLLAAVAGAALGSMPARLSDPVYTSEVAFVVVPNPTAASAETTIRTAVAVLRSPELTRLVADSPTIDLTADEIAAGLVVERPPGSGLLAARFSHESQEVSDGVAQILQSSYPQVIAGLALDNAFVVRGLGDVSTSSQEEASFQYAVIGTVFALIIALVVVALIEQRSHVIRNAAQFAALELPLLATIPARRSRRVSDAGVHAILTAAKRSRSWPADPTTILVAGAESSKERAQLAAAIASSVAATGRETVLVDLDGSGPGAPRRHHLFGLGRFLGTSGNQAGNPQDAATLLAIQPSRLNSFLSRSYSPFNIGLNVVSIGPQQYNEWGWIKIQERTNAVLERGGVVVMLSAPVPDGGLVQRATASADAILFAAVTDLTTSHGARLAVSCLQALSVAPIENVLLRANQFELFPVTDSPSLAPGGSKSIAPIDSARKGATG